MVILANKVKKCVTVYKKTLKYSFLETIIYYCDVFMIISFFWNTFIIFQVAGKLEIRVVPKEQTTPRDPPPAQRPQTLSPPSKPPAQINHDEHPKTNHIIINNNVSSNNHQPQPTEPPKIKLERTKSILKQSSKERSEHPELHSPKRENITFAPDCEKHLQEKEGRKLLEKKVSLEKVEVNSVKKQQEESESSSESSSSESEEEEEEEDEEEEKSKSDLKRSNSSPIRRISITRSSSRINFEPVESLAASQKHLPKPAIEKIRKSLLESRSSESSESSAEKKDSGGGGDKKCVKNSLKTPERGGQCSPSIEVTSNPAFVSVQEQR